MFGRTRAEKIKEGAVGASELALQLAQDKRFRKQLASALEHSARGAVQARQKVGLAQALARVASDRTLLRELTSARRDLERAHARLERKRRSHRLRNVLLVASLGSVLGVPRVRAQLAAAVARATGRARAGSDRGRPEQPDLEDLTKEELYARAQEAGIPGRSEMSKEQLVAALRAQQ